MFVESSVASAGVRRLLALISLALASTATAAAGAGEPETFASATLGSLTVATSALVGPRNADMRAVWTDDKKPCAQTRTLTVRAVIDFVPTGKRYIRAGSFRTPNCAEGGPNMGFTITARAAGFACPNGAWKPGRYAFVTTAVETMSGLRSVVSVGWAKNGRC
jgi:hypothetical protein